jgi:predicted nucleic acid-binding protein
VKCTIDASVFVASVRYDEPGYLTSREFLREAQAYEVYCPALVLTECAAAIARQTDDPTLAEEIVYIIEDFPAINLISLDHQLARKASKIALMNRLRGADAVYAAVAAVFDAVLISWDQEMLKRCPQTVKTISPDEWKRSHQLG